MPLQNLTFLPPTHELDFKRRKIFQTIWHFSRKFLDISPELVIFHSRETCFTSDSSNRTPTTMLDRDRLSDPQSIGVTLLVQFPRNDGDVAEIFLDRILDVDSHNTEAWLMKGLLRHHCHEDGISAVKCYARSSRFAVTISDIPTPKGTLIPQSTAQFLRMICSTFLFTTRADLFDERIAASWVKCGEAALASVTLRGPRTESWRAPAQSRSRHPGKARGAVAPLVREDRWRGPDLVEHARGADHLETPPARDIASTRRSTPPGRAAYAARGRAAAGAG